MYKNGLSTQQKVLDAFRDDPNATVRELAKRVHLSLQGVYYHLTILDRDGKIRMHHEKGNRSGKYHFHTPIERISEIRKNAAKKGKAERKQAEQMRIERVVAKAKARDEQLAFSGEPLASGADVVRFNHSVWGTRGYRVG